MFSVKQKREISEKVKEIIELLEKVNRHIIHHTCGYTVTQDLKTLKDYIQQALIILKQQPTEPHPCNYVNLQKHKVEQPAAGKFTKEIRQRLSEIGRQRPLRPIEKSFWEFCDRLDSAESINKDLLELCEEFMEKADNGSAEFNDPIPGSIFLRAEAVIAKAKKERDK